LVAKRSSKSSRRQVVSWPSRVEFMDARDAASITGRYGVLFYVTSHGVCCMVRVV
jgi:hypothetical protein